METPKKFEYIELPDQRKAPFLNESIDLQDLYSQCVKELTAQQTKRDQLITFYLSITGLVSAYTFSTDANAYIRIAIFLALFVLGCIWTSVVIRYKIYKDAYWMCCKTITSLFTSDRKTIDKSLVQHTFYAVIKKSYSNLSTDHNGQPILKKWIKKNFTSAEYLLFLTMALLTSISGSALLLSLLFLHNIGWISYIITGVFLIAFLVVQTVNYNNAALSVFQVAIDDLDASFNSAFSKAWFLHFFASRDNANEQNGQNNTPAK